MSYTEYANDITGKCEDAAQSMLRASVTAGEITAVASANIVAGCDDEDLGSPRVVCICDSADVEDVFDGNWSARLDVVVIADANDKTRSEFREICGQVWLPFFKASADVNTALSNSTIEFTAQATYPRRQEKSRVQTDDGDIWRGVLSLDVKCCGSVIT
jgi:hypothetical protein